MLLVVLLGWIGGNNNHNGMIEGKKVTGTFKLNGANTEASLTSFAMSTHARGWLDLVFTTKEMYVNEQSLFLHIYSDDEWTSAKKAPTCIEKTGYAEKKFPIRFEYLQPTDSYKAKIGVALNQEDTDTPHYWYIVVDDCSLELYNHDASIPQVTYDLSIWNDVGGKAHSINEPKPVKLTHLPVDEIGMFTLHMLTFLMSFLIAGGMTIRVLFLLSATNTVHAALFLVILAAASDSAASFCELLHLRWYDTNGIGWYFFDALAAHFEAICDSITAILLLSIASGWTLPSDVVRVSSIEGTFVQSLIEGLRNPAGALLSFDKSGIFALLILAAHAGLAQWGRTYDDDFDTYHDLEHPPGRILMMFRIFMGVLMVAATVHTKSSCPLSLQSFYSRLAVVGTLWFQSLPLVTWISGFALPFYRRHPVVSIVGAITQSTALLSLAWLVTGQSNAYQKVSRLQSKDQDLTDQLGSHGMANQYSNGGNGNNGILKPKVWRMGKTKIRLD